VVWREVIEVTGGKKKLKCRGIYSGLNLMVFEEIECEVMIFFSFICSSSTFSMFFINFFFFFLIFMIFVFSN
jgi:hypothetical protein